MSPQLTKHFTVRFSQRVARSKRMLEFANRALRYGREVSSIKNGELRRALAEKENEYSTMAKVYHNSVYWFSGDRAVTVYPLPQKYHGRF